MNPTEQEILNSLKEAEVERKEAVGQLAFHKKAVTDAESNLIAANIKIQRIKEQLRVHRNTTVRHEVSSREKELIEFRRKYPDLCAVWGIWDNSACVWVCAQGVYRTHKDSAQNYLTEQSSEQLELRMHQFDCVHPSSDCCQP